MPYLCAVYKRAVADAPSDNTRKIVLLLSTFLNNFTIMARVIAADKCVACGSCISECPVEAIKEGDVYSIDADACIDCGACEATCPNEAISEA